jgi:20S proteasome subunit beta 5
MATGINLEFLKDSDLDSSTLTGSLEELHGDSNFLLPSVANPASFCRMNFSARYEDRGEMLKLSKGTTTLGMLFQGGVVISVDSRASQGPYVGSQTVKKVIEINPYLLGTMAGGAADCLFWERNLGQQARLYELRNKERISVAAASKLLANTMYSYKGYGLSMGTMVAGWDKNGPGLYHVDDSGTRLKAKQTMPYFAVGSGSTYAYGVLDTEYKWDMTEEEAIELGKRAIYHATFRDAYSGGINNVYVVRQEGWEKVFSGDVLYHHDKYSAEREAAASRPAAGTAEAAAGGDVDMD